MTFNVFGKFPVVKELRDIRAQLADLSIRLDDLGRLKEILQTIKETLQTIKDSTVLTAQDAVLLTAPRYADPRSLARHQAQVYSRHAEDGIIAEIFRRIGTSDQRFVEIGVENGIENNTRLLLQVGWKGVWVEGDAESAAAVRELFDRELTERRLILVNSFVTRENIGTLLAGAGVPSEFDFLSIDIDMNTHHVWEALSSFRPRAACIEYNSSIPPSLDYSVPYDPQGVWSDGSNYFGAGLKALERIGRKLGYNLVGCDYLGVDAFFVREDLCQDRFLEPFTAEVHYEPPRYPLHVHRGHKKYRSD